MASTFGWTLETIYEVTIPELNYVLSGSQKYVTKQNKEMEKASRGRGGSGKVSVDNLASLSQLPCVKTIKKPRKK